MGRNFNNDETGTVDSPLMCTASNCILKAAHTHGSHAAFCGFHEGKKHHDWEWISDNIKYNMDLYKAWRKLTNMPLHDFVMNRDAYKRGSIEPMRYRDGEGLITYSDRFIFNLEQIIWTHPNESRGQ